jgi:hypothetical protein
MAYRKLRDGDLVRITGKYVDFSGCNAIVIDAGEMLTRVQVQNRTNVNETPTICLTINNDHLKIRHEPHGYIVDGRIDHAKKSALEARRVEYNRDDFEEDECEFDDCDRDDLIDMIIKLRNDVATLSS